MVMNQVRDNFIPAGEHTFIYVQWRERGSPMVGVSGITANAFCFQAIADDLARDHRVYAYDLRGRGDGDKPEHGYSVASHAHHLANLIDTRGLQRPVVLGHSLGGLVAIYFAPPYQAKVG